MPPQEYFRSSIDQAVEKWETCRLEENAGQTARDLVAAVEDMKNDEELELFRLILLSPQEEPQVIKISFNREAEIEIRSALRAGSIPLGVLKWEINSEGMIPRGFYFRGVHQSRFSDLFDEICNEEIESVRTTGKFNL